MAIKAKYFQQWGQQFVCHGISTFNTYRANIILNPSQSERRHLINFKDFDLQRRFGKEMRTIFINLPSDNSARFTQYLLFLVTTLSTV